ncbi:MAG: radical SAM protein [Trichlorobacter sp.]|uniref:radical SAM protein n=1 Tax=Trichlorobacter sp. TaxID=2911007 RepID=UPI00255E97E9|nr:radical SAM protein [Trichlorobacter sp.]MDK9718659.1 radical SAM protein [Trichlorobacter sp.]
MGTTTYTYLYGPVPSHRLGRSLGIDLVPYKICSYDCIYCQLGSIGSTIVTRKKYADNDRILEELQRKLSDHSQPDFISLAGSGEPTLHSGIGELIRRIKMLTTVPLAVLTNGSLLWLPEVQEDLMAADLVLPSLDAGDPTTFQQANRPDSSISFDQMVQGLIDFTGRFAGEVWLEVLLLAGISDDEPSVRRIAKLVERIKPARVQLNTVYRPPAESFACGVTHGQLCHLSSLFSGLVDCISDAPAPAAATESTGLSHQDEIIAFARRRPCTIHDLSTGLNLHLNDVLKQVRLLTDSGSLIEIAGKRGYFGVPPAVDILTKSCN